MDFIINESHLSLKSMAITYYYLSLICYNKSNESKSKLMMISILFSIILHDSPLLFIMWWRPNASVYYLIMMSELIY